MARSQWRKIVGYRRILGTEWPIYAIVEPSVLYKRQWASYLLCNGRAYSKLRHKTKRDAIASFMKAGEDECFGEPVHHLQWVVGPFGLERSPRGYWARCIHCGQFFEIPVATPRQDGPGGNEKEV